jgi:hypothetical protein
VITRLRLRLMLGVLMTVLVLPMLGVAAITTTASPANAAFNCSCVIYVRNQTGLPGGPAAAADYTERQMNAFGYRRVLPQAGAIFVWDRWQKGAINPDGTSDGHMALINFAGYNNQTKKWVISVNHVNWAGNCAVSQKTFSWGDLYGVNAYVRR